MGFCADAFGFTPSKELGYIYIYVKFNKYIYKSISFIKNNKIFYNIIDIFYYGHSNRPRIHR